MRLYLLADQLRDVVTANLVIDEMIRIALETHSYPSLTRAADVYSNTATSSPLRRLVRDFMVCATSVPPTDPEVLAQEGMVELLYDVYCEFVRLGSVGQASPPDFRRVLIAKPKCYYQQHDDEHPKCEGGEQSQDSQPIFSIDD